MKTSLRLNSTLSHLRIGTLLLAGLAAGAGAAPASTWTNLVSGNASGLWGTAANWSNGIPNATDAIADFSLLTITANSTVSNNAPRTAGTLQFANGSGKLWTLDGGTTNQLTLATSTGQPVIGVTNTEVVFGGFNGTNGFIKNGSGVLGLYGKTDTNILSGPIVVNGGLLGMLYGKVFQNVSGNITVNSGGTFQINANFDGTVLTNNIYLNGPGETPAGYINNVATLDGTFYSDSTPFGALDIYGNSIVTGPIVLNGNTTISHGYNGGNLNGPITVNGAGANLTLNITVSGQGQLVMGGGINLGTGMLIASGVTGSGGVQLTQSNAYAGGTIVSGTLLQLGAPHALDPTGALAITNGTLDLRTNNLTVPSLTGSVAIITDNSAVAGTTAVTVNQSGATTFAGAINNGATRTLSLTLGGTGALTLTGTSTFGGGAAVNAGELVGTTGGALANSAVTVAAGATNGVQAVSFGAQWSCAGLTYGSGTSYLDVNLTALPVSTTVAPLQVNGNLTANGTVDILVRNGYFPAAGTYPLVSYTGTLGGTGSFVLTTLPAGVTATLVNNTVAKRLDLSVTAVPTVTQPTSAWTNLVSGNAGGIWGTNINWSPNTVPNAANAVANFSPVTITVNSFVTNDAPHTAGTLSFANGSGHQWTVDGTNNQLTLATTLGLATVNVTNTQVLLGGFNGTSGLIKNGNGVLAIYGQNYSNSLTGPIVVNGGLLGSVNSAAFKYITGPITVASGASFEANANYGSTTFGQTIYLSGSGVAPAGYIGNSASPDGTYNGEPSFGAMDLHGNVTYSGTINLNGSAVITHGYNNAAITGPIVASGTGQNLQLGITVSGQYPVTVGGAISLGSGALTVNSVTNGGAAQSPAAAVILNAANSYTGGTVVTNFAILQLGNAGALGSGGLTLYANSKVNLNTYGVSVASLAGTAGSVITDLGAAGTTTLTVNQSAATTFAGSITNGPTRTVALTKQGAGTLSLSGNSTYTGLTTVSAGTLTGVTGGSLSNSIVTLANNVTAGIQVMPAAGQWICAGLTNNGTNTLNFDFTSTTPSTSVAPLQINGNATFNGTVNINCINGTGFVAGNNYPLITCSGSLIGNIPATVVLPPRVAATLVNSGGTLWLDVSATGAEPLTWATGNGFWDTNTTDWVDANASPTTYQQTSIGDAVVFNDTASGASPIAVVLDQTVIPASVTVNNSSISNYVISTLGGGQIAGAGSLTKLGTGTLTLSTANSYTGGTVVSNGVLVLGSGGTLGSTSGSLFVGGGTLNLGGSSQTVGAAVFGGAVTNGTLTASGFTGINGTISANLAGATAALSMIGTNKTLVLAGANTYGGGTTVSAGTIQLGQDNALGTGPVTVASGPGTPTVWLNLNGHTLTNTIANTGGDCYLYNSNSTQATLTGPVGIGAYTRIGYYGQTIPGVGNILISGVYSGGWYTKLGAGALILTATNTYTGATLVNGGAVRAADGTGITTANLVMSDTYGVGAVFESPGGNIIRSLGTGANQVQMTNGNCGFSAYGAPVTVALGGLSTPATLVWGTTNFNITSLILNYNTANTNLTLLNSLDLNGTSQQINVDASVASINGPIIDSPAAGAGLTIGGAGGTLNLNGTNTFTGGTTVTNGTLGGTGSLAGWLLVNSPATLAPGKGSVIGTFTVGGTVTLSGGLTVSLNRTNAQNADRLTASGIYPAGPLTVANIGPALQAGDSFQIMNGSISGAFTVTNLPALGTGLSWDTSALYSSGVIAVASATAPVPTILPVTTDGSGNLIIQTVTVAGHNYLLESTTNLNPPIVWVTNSTTAGTGGTITNSVTIDPAQAASFFRYQAQ